MKSRLIISIFYFLIFSVSLPGQSNALGQNNCNPKSDSLLVKYYLDSLNGDSSDNGTSYSEGQFYYSPGNYFKILVISGESCGMYCNPVYSSYIFYEGKNKLVIAPVNFSNIEGIYELRNKRSDSKEFLVIDQTWCRPRSVEAGIEKSFTHLKLGDTVSFVPIRMLKSQQPDQICFSVYTGSACSGEMEKQNVGYAPVLYYNPKAKLISYVYFEYLDQSGNCYEVIGTFQYKKGEFVQQPEGKVDEPVEVETLPVDGQ